MLQRVINITNSNPKIWCGQKINCSWIFVIAMREVSIPPSILPNMFWKTMVQCGLTFIYLKQVFHQIHPTHNTEKMQSSKSNIVILIFFFFFFFFFYLFNFIFYSYFHTIFIFFIFFCFLIYFFIFYFILFYFIFIIFILFNFINFCFQQNWSNIFLK